MLQEFFSRIKLFHKIKFSFEMFADKSSWSNILIFVN